MRALEIALKEIKRFFRSFAVQALIDACFVSVAVIAFYFAATLPFELRGELNDRLSTLSSISVEDVSFNRISALAKGLNGSVLYSAENATYGITFSADGGSADIVKNSAGAITDPDGFSLFVYLEERSGLKFESPVAPGDENAVMLSESLAQTLGVRTGGTITYTADGASLSLVVRNVFLDTEGVFNLPFIVYGESFSNIGGGGTAAFYALDAESALRALRAFDRADLTFRESSGLYDFYKQSLAVSAALWAAFALFALFGAFTVYKNFDFQLLKRGDFMTGLGYLGASRAFGRKIYSCHLILSEAAALPLGIAVVEAAICGVAGVVNRYFDYRIRHGVLAAAFVCCFAIIFLAKFFALRRINDIYGGKGK